MTVLTFWTGLAQCSQYEESKVTESRMVVFEMTDEPLENSWMAFQTGKYYIAMLSMEEYWTSLLPACAYMGTSDRLVSELSLFHCGLWQLKKTHQGSRTDPVTPITHLSERSERVEPSLWLYPENKRVPFPFPAAVQVIRLLNMRGRPTPRWKTQTRVWNKTPQLHRWHARSDFSTRTPFHTRRHKVHRPALWSRTILYSTAPALNGQRTTTATSQRNNAERDKPGRAKVRNAVGHKMAIFEDWHMYTRASHFSTDGNQKQ